MEPITTIFNTEAAYQWLLLWLWFFLAVSEDADKVQERVQKRRLDRRAVSRPKPVIQPVPVPRFG